MACEERIAPKAMMAAATKNNEQNRRRHSDGINVQKASREDDLPIDFIKRGVVILFLIFLAGLLNCINCNPVPRRTKNHSHEALLKKRPHFG
jgi:hypothetical protein